MENENRSVGGEAGAAERDIRDTRAAVDWYYGDLVDDVVGEHPVSQDGLLSALTRVELEARSRRDQLEQRAEPVPTKGAPGEVLALPVGTFQVLTRAHDLSEPQTAAVQAVHNRMARSIARPPEDDDVVPLVLSAEPTDL
jgi:hypothetical protein